MEPFEATCLDWQQAADVRKDDYSEASGYPQDAIQEACDKDGALNLEISEAIGSAAPPAPPSEDPLERAIDELCLPQPDEDFATNMDLQPSDAARDACYDFSERGCGFALGLIRLNRSSRRAQRPENGGSMPALTALASTDAHGRMRLSSGVSLNSIRKRTSECQWR